MAMHGRSLELQSCRGKEADEAEFRASFQLPILAVRWKLCDAALKAANLGIPRPVWSCHPMVQEVTTLRKAMESAQRVADDLSDLIDAANAPIVGINVDGRADASEIMACEVSEWNRKVAALTGFDKQEVPLHLLALLCFDDFDVFVMAASEP
eukprot:Skav225558  [mRNA]  locus=scaffold81:383930:386424:+ [translate_table: standard]